jgi:hypothetical protein
MKSENNPNHEISENKLQDMGKSVAVCQPNNNDVVRSVEERQHVTSKIDDAEKLYNNINDVNDKILQKLKKIQEMQDKCSNVDMLYKSKCYVIRNLLEQHETLKSRIIPPYDKDFIIRTIICSVSTALERSCMIAARQDIFLSEDILDSLSEDISNTVDLGDDFLKELNADLKNVLMKAKELNDDCSDSELPKCQEYAGCVNTQLENNKMFKIKPKKEPWLPFLGCTIL